MKRLLFLSIMLVAFPSFSQGAERWSCLLYDNSVLVSDVEIGRTIPTSSVVIPEIRDNALQLTSSDAEYNLVFKSPETPEFRHSVTIYRENIEIKIFDLINKELQRKFRSNPQVFIQRDLGNGIIIGYAGKANFVVEGTILIKGKHVTFEVIGVKGVDRESVVRRALSLHGDIIKANEK